MCKALVPGLLLFLTALWAVQAQAEVKAVKLCGREFLRAVVYTCGGSRWRRTFTDDGPLSAESLSAWGPGTDLRRRDMNSILTSVCCTMGCRKSDLSLLC